MNTMRTCPHGLAAVAATAALCTLLATAAWAGTYYIAPDGKESGDGSREKPWPSTDHAFWKVGGGHTFVFKPGVYRGPVNVRRQNAGTREHPTVLKSEIKWQAVIIGAPAHAIDSLADWVVVDGFQVFGARIDGIKMEADDNVVRNCWVHNNSDMGVAIHGRKRGVIEYNLIEFNGCHPHYGHGVYADGDGLVVRGNIVRHNAGYGLQLYPSLLNCVVENNLIANNVNMPGLIVCSPKGNAGGHNRIVNNTFANNNGGLSIWHGNGELVANNIIVSEKRPILFEQHTTNCVVEFNLIAPPTNTNDVNSISGDSIFVEHRRGCYWLRGGSPAIGKGAPPHAPATDFWGRPRAKDRPSDLGAFPFERSLLTDTARATWFLRWPYSYSPQPGEDLPDLWTLPPESHSRVTE